MPDLDYQNLGPQQQRVLEVIWQRNGATVHEVLDELLADSPGPTLAYTTVLTTLQKLEKAGWLVHDEREKQGRAYVYTPTLSRQEALGGTLRNLAKSLFGGDKLLMFQHFVDEGELTDNEIREIRNLIASRDKKKERR
jgi:predicted transcriptional regulator